MQQRITIFGLITSFIAKDRGMAMGAKYALSLANLLMAKWVEDVIHAQQRPQAILWARYIDDIFLLWGGTHSELLGFMESLNNNNRGIVLNFETTKEEINFLDLKVSIREKRFVNTTFFKPTDRNSYIPLDSCHHGSWLKAVRKIQFLQLRRNCSEVAAFYIQAKVLHNRFVEKGYNSNSLQTTISSVRNLDRMSLLTERPRDGNNRISLFHLSLHFLSSTTV